MKTNTLAILTLLSLLPLAAFADEGGYDDEIFVSPTEKRTAERNNYMILEAGYSTEWLRTHPEAAHGGALDVAFRHQGSIYRFGFEVNSRSTVALQAEVVRGAVHVGCDPSSAELFCVRIEGSVDAAWDTSGEASKLNVRAFLTPTIRLVDDAGNVVGFGVSGAAGGILTDQLPTTPYGAGPGALLFIDTKHLNVSASGDYLYAQDSGKIVKKIINGNLDVTVPLGDADDQIRFALFGRAKVTAVTERSRDILFGGSDENKLVELKTLFGIGGQFQ